MSYTITKADKSINGEVQVPSSKSISNRLLIIRALTKKDFSIQNLSDSDDTNLLFEALSNTNEVIDIGHAGTSMRFLTAFFASTEGVKILTGSERMKNRPIGKLVEVLAQLGATIEYGEKEGYPPLLIKGEKIAGGISSIDGSVSSQFISALLMVAPTFKNGLELYLKNKVISTPYIKMTIGLMKVFGVNASFQNNSIIVKPQTYKPKDIIVETDWSGASYWYEIAALSDAADVFILGLNKNSLQGDARVAEIFKSFGVLTHFEKNGIRLSKTSIEKPDSFEFDFLENPDLVQTVAVTCVMKKTPFKFSGTQSLRIKETDRITALQNELGKFGALLNYDASGILSWDGRFSKKKENIIAVATYNDHRMAMAFAPVALCEGIVAIENPQVVSKSYPAFWENLKMVGFGVK